MGRAGRIGLAYACGAALGLVAAQRLGWLQPPPAHPSIPQASALEGVRVDPRRCANGDGSACLREAHALAHTSTGDHDVVAIDVLLEKACGLAQLDACDELGVALRAGDGVEQDPRRAFALFQRACTLGLASGCVHLSELYRGGEGVDLDSARANLAVNRACDLGNASACRTIGRALLRSDRAGDPAKAIPLLTRACALDAKHCQDLGRAYEDGAAVVRDLAHAHSLFQLGCDADDPYACNSLGELWLAHPELPNSGGLDRARDLFKRACDEGVERGCSNFERGEPRKP